MLVSLAERFASVIRERGIQVLVIHGVNDLLVPISNSRRLVSVLGPSATLIEVPECGHQPQEEMPDLFAGWVKEFVLSCGGKGHMDEATEPGSGSL